MTDVENPSGSNSSRIPDLLCDPELDSKQLEVAPTTVIHEADTPARELYFIKAGQVRIFLPGGENAARLVEILGPGDWFGVPALAGGEGTYGSRAIAVAPVQLCQVPAARLMGQLARMPEIAAELIQQLARKLRVAHEDAANLVFEDTNQRLIKTLLQFSRSAAATPEEGGPGIILRITHQQLAQAVGAARETISLALTQLRQQNLLRTGRNRLWFDPGALEEFSKRAKPEKPEGQGVGSDMTGGEGEA
jgi:CRP-like cAMP-binding protein